MRRLLELPLLVFLMAIAGLAMLLPAGFALATADAPRAAAFGQGALLLIVGTAILGVATAQHRPKNVVRSQVVSLVGAYLLLPPLLAVPMAAATDGLTLARAWFEMVSAFTTTGATLLEAPAAVPPAVQLWRALVGWLGGFFVLLVATALLAPLNLGGLEVESDRPPGRVEPGGEGATPTMETSERLVVYLRLLAPIYGGFTAALWIGLTVAGDPPFVALCHAMSILATSGISPAGGLDHGGAGRLGEALMLGFLVFAVSRRSLPGRIQPDQRRPLHRDPELRVAALLLGLLTLLLFVRHWLGAFGRDEADDLASAGRALWGIGFTLASFLTTNGFVSADWAEARAWSGLTTPGLLLAGLALLGGGVATTAGGVKLLRVYALYRHGRQELEKLVHPALVGGGGRRARWLRGEGAYAAWIAFMLFLVSLAAVMSTLAISGMVFEHALIFTVAALTTTGPLAGVVGETGLSYTDLGGGQRAILAFAMILGRLEMLAIVALLVPESWRD
jgi:trk system potassium uptake protein